MKTYEEITERINARTRINVTLWQKKGNRLYINGYGHDTNKCKQTIYIDLESFTVRCFTDCPSQPYAWCISQSKEVEERLAKYARYARMIRNSTKELSPLKEKTDTVIYTETAIIEYHIPARVESVNIFPNAALIR